jgi:hypothetical protein
MATNMLPDLASDPPTPSSHPYQPCVVRHRSKDEQNGTLVQRIGKRSRFAVHLPLPENIVTWPSSKRPQIVVGIRSTTFQTGNLCLVFQLTNPDGTNCGKVSPAGVPPVMDNGELVVPVKSNTGQRKLHGPVVLTVDAYHALDDSTPVVGWMATFHLDSAPAHRPPKIKCPGVTTQ